MSTLELEHETQMKEFVPQSPAVAGDMQNNDVERLQKYLAKFGYFRDQITPNLLR